MSNNFEQSKQQIEIVFSDNFLKIYVQTVQKCTIVVTLLYRPYSIVTSLLYTVVTILYKGVTKDQCCHNTVQKDPQTPFWLTPQGVLFLSPRGSFFGILFGFNQIRMSGNVTYVRTNITGALVVQITLLLPAACCWLLIVPK